MRAFSPRLKELAERLSELPRDSKPMRLSAYDGFVAGLIVCPDLIPPSEWLPRVFGVENETGGLFDTVEEANTLLDQLIEHYNRTANDIHARRYRPIFHFDGDGTAHWQEWMDGFTVALQLHPASWLEFTLADRLTSTTFVTLVSLSLANQEGADAIDGLEELVKEAAVLILAGIPILDAWSSARQRGIEVAPGFAKVGRNERCPCGSGKKYKKCCAVNSTGTGPRQAHIAA
jgi:uncharacterized protein